MSRAALLVLALFASACGSDSTATAGSGGKDAGSGGASGATGAGGASGGSAGSGASGGSAGSGATGGTSCKATLPAPTVVDANTTPELAIAGDPGAPLGMFDPSVIYPLGAPAGALSYSAVSAKDDIVSRIAVSSDAGATWTFVANANASSAMTIPAHPSSKLCPAGSCTGRVIHEVSSLVYDADDPDAARRWKLFTHSYLVLSDGTLGYDIGYIELFVAPEPQGPWSSEGNSIGWNGQTDFSSQGAATLASSFPALADCGALTEPAALWHNGGVLDLALGCVVLGSPPTIRIEVLRSLDHAKTFDYAGRLLDGNDALCLGSSTPAINAADLFIAGGKTYLSATPTGKLQNPPGADAYKGCFVFQVSGGTTLARDPNGAPIVTRLLDSADQRFTGACSVAEGATAMGYLVPEANLTGSPPVFRVYRSGISAP